MNLTEYQTKAATTAVYDPEVARYYTVLGLASEAGEVAGALKKYTRGDFDLEILRRRVAAELGDVLWYVAAVASAFNLDLDELAKENLARLTIRFKENQIRGNGSNRGTGVVHDEGGVGWEG
jgi:NTP pyrophosphatase (non-canonical NTP hydrolase)